MKHILRNIASLSLVAFLSTEVLAHPGHGDSGPAHYVTEPQHAIVLVAVFAAAVAGLVIALRRSSAKSPIA